MNPRPEQSAVLKVVILRGAKRSRRAKGLFLLTWPQTFARLTVTVIAAIFLLPGAPALHAQTKLWRPATETELHSIIPARAPAISERIETEFRTASGITDGRDHFIAGVVMITAGYSAEGKYSHYFLTQVPMKVGSLLLAPGDYLFGWTRSQDTLRVSFYQAATGKPVGEIDANRDPSTTRVESFRIWPPNDKSIIQIGRFSFSYSLVTR